MREQKYVLLRVMEGKNVLAGHQWQTPQRVYGDTKAFVEKHRVAATLKDKNSLRNSHFQSQIVALTLAAPSLLADVPGADNFYTVTMRPPPSDHVPEPVQDDYRGQSVRPQGSRH